MADIGTRVTVLEVKVESLENLARWAIRSTITTAIATCGILLGIIFQVLHK